MTEVIRRYREAILWFHRDERIEKKDMPRKKGDIEVEYYDAIDSISKSPDHLGNRVNIIV